jgi:nucleotide-binding universal stress UspA family protein
MYTNILVPIDLDDKYSWQICLKKALQIKVVYPDAKIHILTVIQTFVGIMEDFFPQEWLEGVQVKVMEELQKIVANEIPKNIDVSLHVASGVVYQAILDKAEEIKSDLIIISAHHPDRRDYLLGPSAARVVRHADVSVLVVRGK